MKCYICGRSPEDFKDFVNVESSKVGEAIKTLQVQMTGYKRAYEASRSRFIDGKTRVRDLNSEIARLKISTIKTDLDSFRKIIPSIDLIVEYFDTARPPGATTIGDVAELIAQEPMYSTMPEMISIEKQIAELMSFEFDPNSIRFFERTIEKTEISEAQAGIDRAVHSLTRGNPENSSTYQTPRIKYFLCPVCNSMLHESARAAFQTSLAANDFGDDDDYR